MGHSSQQRLVRHRAALFAVIAVMASAAGGQPAAALPGPFSLTVSAGGASTKASLASYCPHGGPSPPCVGSQIDPTPRIRLPVRPRQTLRLNLPEVDPAARRVIVVLGRSGRTRPNRAVTIWTKRAAATGTTGRRWRVRLPRDVRDASFVSARISYTGSRPPAVNGSARFIMGVRLACAPD